MEFKLYPASLFPSELFEIYHKLFTERLKLLESEGVPSVRLQNAVETWKEYLTKDNCNVAVLFVNNEAVVFALTLDYPDKRCFHLAELKYDLKYEHLINDFLNEIMKQYVDKIAYAIVHESNKLYKSFFENMTGRFKYQESIYWFQEIHPLQTKEDGWISLSIDPIHTKEY